MTPPITAGSGAPEAISGSGTASADRGPAGEDQHGFDHGDQPDDELDDRDDHRAGQPVGDHAAQRARHDAGRHVGQQHQRDPAGAAPVAEHGEGQCPGRHRRPGRVDLVRDEAPAESLVAAKRAGDPGQVPGSGADGHDPNPP
jgi:hypothetical protein